ncbi:MAG: dephospho-CoA kinase [Alphaproteobacteria bacterium]|nr:dephospho-CoA kinase [Alphaproteobacteria bacterium]
MFILGLTGSIGMGKSTAAAMFGALGVPVHDADAAVHAALAPGGSGEAAVTEAFPEAALGPAIDRQKLGAAAFADSARLRLLESILHPLAAASAARFLRFHGRHAARLAVLDIPLLYETGMQARTDAVLVISAPLFLQRQRVLTRPGMSLTQFERICANQMPDREKRAAADFVVLSGLAKGQTFAALKQLVGFLADADGRIWGPSYFKLKRRHEPTDRRTRGQPKRGRSHA